MYRCMHDAPPVSWNSELAQQALNWVQKFPPMSHADTYNLSPPQGENLAMNMPSKDIHGRVYSWYREVENCDQLPGCEHSTKPGKHTGHFTALVWRGVSEIGCASSKGSDGAWY